MMGGNWSHLVWSRLLPALLLLLLLPTRARRDEMSTRSIVPHPQSIPQSTIHTHTHLDPLIRSCLLHPHRQPHSRPTSNDILPETSLKKPTQRFSEAHSRPTLPFLLYPYYCCYYSYSDSMNSNSAQPRVCDLQEGLAMPDPAGDRDHGNRNQG